jgi:hypothetical protein
MPNKEISLFNLKDKFGHFHVKIDQKFLKELLVKAAKHEKPHCDKEFVKKLGLKMTTKYSCYTIYGWVNADKTIPLGKLAKVIDMANYPWREVESKIISIKAGQKRGEVCPKFPIKFNKQLGTIIGHILGEFFSQILTKNC